MRVSRFGVETNENVPTREQRERQLQTVKVLQPMRVCSDNIKSRDQLERGDLRIGIYLSISQHQAIETILTK
jgi:hypothetical protein